MKALVLMTKTPEHFGDTFTTKRLNKRELDYHFYFKFAAQYILTQVLFVKLQEPTKNLESLIERTRVIKDGCVVERLIENEGFDSYSLLYLFEDDTDLSMFETDHKTAKPFMIQHAGDSNEVIETEVFCVVGDEDDPEFLKRSGPIVA